jgi:uncharacterized protein YkwD
VALLFAAPPASADTIVTVTGRTLRGQIVKETRREVQIRDSRGLIATIPRDEIEDIVLEDNATVYAEKLATLVADDAKGFFALAKWAKAHGLMDEAKACLKKTLAADSEHAKARKALGYRNVEGRWLRGAALKKALGLVRHRGKWITPAEKLKREAAAKAKTVQASSGLTDGAAPKTSTSSTAIVLPEEDAALLSIVRGSSALPRRTEAMRVLSRKGGDAGSALRRELETMLGKARKKLVGHFKNSKGKIRGKLAKKIRTRRKAALAVIFDKAKYPDANHGAAGQHLVDQVVGELLRAYDDPFGELRTDDAVTRLLEKVTRAAGWLRQFSGAEASDQSLLAEVQAEVATAIDMTSFPIDATDAKILKRSRETLKANAAIKTSLTEQERDCILATNQYRMKFGLKALSAFEPLVQAARGHSGDMLQRNFFDHTSPVAGKRTPAMRCKAQGATFSGENIAMGMQSGRGAFNAWYRSSGHHRNMLGKGHRSIGIGQAGKYWTQNFGYDSP